MTPLDISIVVLAKDTDQAKTRFSPDAGRSRGLAMELAKNTLSTALSVLSTPSLVHVVTSDPEITHWAEDRGMTVVREGRPIGMNAAGSLGRRRALASNPRSPIAVVVADLPELSVGDLTQIAAEHDDRQVPLFVPDQNGDGTTCLIHGPRVRPGLGFGRRSADLHLRLGYAAAQRPMRGLRRDLDTPSDLAMFDAAALQALVLA